MPPKGYDYSKDEMAAATAGLSAAIESAGSQAKLATMLEVSRQAISSWVKRGFVPTESAKAVSEATEVPINDLVPTLRAGAAQFQRGRSKKSAKPEAEASQPYGATDMQDYWQGMHDHNVAVKAATDSRKGHENNHQKKGLDPDASAIIKMFAAKLDYGKIKPEDVRRKLDSAVWGLNALGLMGDGENRLNTETAPGGEPEESDDGLDDGDGLEGGI